MTFIASWLPKVTYTQPVVFFELVRVCADTGKLIKAAHLPIHCLLELRG
jgi:hypothetical protein